MPKGKQIVIQLNTETGQKSFKTQKITGNLNAIILESEEKISIMIESSLGYLIFQKVEFQGVEYFAVRKRQEASEFNARDQLGFDKFALNEEIVITVIGPKNSDIKLILRLD